MKFLFITLLSVFISNSQPTPNNQPTPKYTWMGKEVTYKQFRDSLRVNYLNFCDSLKRKSSR